MLYPLLFHSILKPRVWGGRNLEAFGKDLPAGAMIGESWELADLPDAIPEGRSVIANGPLSGRTLREAIAADRDAIMGDARLTPHLQGGFPLLIKYLDARENLSVQVHPTPQYAAAHPGAHLKSEAWVVVKAEPGAAIYKGVRPSVTAEQFADHIRRGTAHGDLIRVPVRVGDCHYLPSGTCHALGAGIVVAEIQTPSDTTFRVYDWGRPAAAGRELHVEQALQCIAFGVRESEEPRKLHKPIQSDGLTTTPLTATEYFQIDRLDASRPAEFNIVTSGLPEVWMLIGGSGQMRSSVIGTVELRPGTTVLVPALLEDVRVQLLPRAWMLRVKLPSPLRRMIA